jgi:hypothetical protein
MKQISAVEWLVQELHDNGYFHEGVPEDIVKKAKEMEKEQIIEFAKDCIHKDDCFFIVEQYYKETFKSE